MVGQVISNIWNSCAWRCTRNHKTALSAQKYTELAAKLLVTDGLINDAAIEYILQLRKQAVGELSHWCEGQMLVYRKELTVCDQMWRGETDILNEADCPHCDYWIASGGQLRHWWPNAAAVDITLLAWIPLFETVGVQRAMDVSTGAALNWASDDDADAVVALSLAVQRDSV